MATSAINKAIQFVVEQGDVTEQARLRYLLDKTQPDAAVIAQFIATQRPDGGWAPFWAADYSSVDATSYHLTQADQLGLEQDALVVNRAIGFLLSRQHHDGLWQEEAGVAEHVPPWATPGDLAATLYLTANSSYWLTRFASASDHIKRAADFLMNYHDEGSLPSFLHTHWLAAGLWYSLGRQEVSEQTMAHLKPQVAAMSADNLAWLVTTLRGVGVPAAHPLLVAATARLAEQQQADGHWHSDDGAAFHVHVTLEALRALHLCGAF
jgi:hypothetical protein